MSVGMEPQNQKFVTIQAAEDLSDKKYFFVDSGGNLCGAADPDMLGVLWFEGESGCSVTVCVDGTCLVRCPAGSKITIGDVVNSNASGEAIATTTAGQEGFKCVQSAQTNGGLGMINLNSRLRIHA